MEPRRVVKVDLPARLVAAMDDELATNSGYDRSTFVADAIEGLLAELRAGETQEEDAWELPQPPPRPGGVSRAALALPSRSALDASDEWAGEQTPSSLRLTIESPAPDTPTVSISDVTATEPTWGMHNRDWPTLWAASQLGELSRRGPVAFDEWANRLAQQAYTLTVQFDDPDLDLSGLPSDRNKKLDRSLGRFRSFFVGDDAGKGPLFSLGLAAQARDPKTVLLSAPGADLLRALNGLEPRKTRMRDDWRAAFLTHLAAWVPPDFAFLRSVITHVLAGRAKRMELLQSVAGEHPEWTESVVATNVAGFIARGREWNLFEPTQEGGRYHAVSDASDALEVAQAAVEELRGRYA